mgnify:CR=1 FL=1
MKASVYVSGKYDSENLIIELDSRLELFFALRGKSKKTAEKLLLSYFKSKSVDTDKVYANIELMKIDHDIVDFTFRIMDRDFNGFGYCYKLKGKSDALERLRLITIDHIIGAKLKNRPISPSKLFRTITRELGVPFEKPSDIVEEIAKLSNRS